MEERFNPQKRLWADTEEVDSLIMVGPWQNTVDKFLTKSIPCGIVFRAAKITGLDLNMTFKEWTGDEEEGTSHIPVWHTTTSELAAAERVGLKFNFAHFLNLLDFFHD